MSQQSNASVFQACSNVTVNGGSFSVSGRDSHTSTVHYHSGSQSHHFDYAHNVNTGTNHGSFGQGAPGGIPPYPPPPPYMGYGYGASGYPPAGSYSTSSYHYQGQRQRNQTYPQPAGATPGSNGQVPPFNTGSGSSTPQDRNPFRQSSEGFAQSSSSTPPNPRRTSSDCAQAEDDVEVTELESPGVAEENGTSKAQYSTWGASAHATFTTQSPRM